MDEQPTHLDLFSGIGGFALAAAWAGFQTVAFCEINEPCRALLKLRFPGIRVLRDVRRLIGWLPSPDLLTGGDPCPKHSRARSNGESNHPDLSGYFLSVVGRCRPGWVVRENVPAPNQKYFVAAMEAIGYGAVIVRANADSFTAQCRQRDFIVGCHSLTAQELKGAFAQICQDGPGTYTTRLGTREITPALTTHRTRYDSRDCYVYDSTGLRILESDEREALAGFPRGWTAGFSAATRAHMLGNSLVPQVAFEIFKAIHSLI